MTDSSETLKAAYNTETAKHPRLIIDHEPKGIARAIAPIALLAIMSGLLVDSAFRRSPTSDEPYHLIRGLSFWWTGSSQLSYAHPPLANAVTSIPSALFFEKTDFTEYPAWNEGKVERLSNAYFVKYYKSKARLQLIISRIMMAVLGVLLGAYLFFLCRRHWGWWTAVIALSLFIFNPTLLAHGRLMTTDLPMAFVTVLLVGEFIYFLQMPGIVPFIRIGAAVSVALLTKYTALPLVMFLGALGVVFALRGCARFRKRRISVRLFSYFAQIVLIGVMAIISINAIYEFDRTFMTVEEILDEPEPFNSVTKYYGDEMLERSLLAKLPSTLRVPLPYTYVLGLFSVAAHAERGHSSWFLGEKQKKGSPIYFPLLLLLKTPVVYWIFLIIGIIGFIHHPKPPGLLTLVTGSVVLFLLAMIIPAKINIGVRHALPIVPLLAMLAARAIVRSASLASLLEIRKRPLWIYRHAVYIGMTLLPIGVAATYPDFLGYFNMAIGRSLGHKISIIGEDWGQDEIQFAKYVKDNNLKPLHYRPSSIGGALELKRKKIKYHKVNCGKTIKKGPDKPVYYAIHANTLVRRRCLPRKGHIEELDRFNDHIVVFRYWPE
jgi:hypothetical protein